MQIRNAATVGGNLCNASPCADMAPPLLVHDARVRIRAVNGDRELPLEDFFVAPGSVGPRPMRLHDVEAALTGQTLDDAALAKAREVASAEVQPISDVRAGETYRRHLAGAFVERAARGTLAAVNQPAR